ncbi:hypothetical protein PRZ48_007432 [Zasmidium cellare]|uniref:Calcium-transporting ATPase n=1 Tax=Zasmidium cellare TaxID=395010 RepID=A0ABR0ELG7_ZASCE|nr:hypothetical protein PRZ48_007432 [Zasmidium cellare]
MSNNDNDSHEPAPQTPSRRRGAPTINIDTLMNPPEPDSMPDAKSPVTITIDKAADATPSDYTPSPATPLPSPRSRSSSATLCPPLERFGSMSMATIGEVEAYQARAAGAALGMASDDINMLPVPMMRSRTNSLQSDVTYASSADGSVPASPASRSTQELLKVHNYSSSKDTGRNFSLSPVELDRLMNPKSTAILNEMGGLRGLERGLLTDVKSGLSVDETYFETPPSDGKNVPSRVLAVNEDLNGNEFQQRKDTFGTNRLPQRRTKSIWHLLWLTYNDKVLILLTIAAVISLALGIYQTLTSPPTEPHVQWVEGVAIIVAILVVVIIGAGNDWQKERQFAKLNKKKDDRSVKVRRSGKTMEISVHDVLVGDVMHIEPGDVVPVDGVFIEGHKVKCDESSATGESALLAKTPAVWETSGQTELCEDLKQDPFIISGAQVVDGVGTFLVTATGENSLYGRTLLSLDEEAQTTALQAKLNVLAEQIAKCGLAAGLILFVALFIKFLVGLKGLGSAEEKGQAFLQIFIVAVTIIVVAVPEGLPLAVTLALAFATTRMFKDNNLVRYLRSCEVMGNATTICSDKTGTLTENRMAVVVVALPGQTSYGAEDAVDASLSAVVKGMNAPAKKLLLESISFNSTAFEGEDDSGIAPFVGSRTECALLMFARDFLGMGPVSEERSNAHIVQMVPFKSERKWMAVVVKVGTKYRLYVKGASEIVLAASTGISSETMGSQPMSNEDRLGLERTITAYASRSLRTIAVAYRDLEHWRPVENSASEAENIAAGFNNLTMLRIFGIQDPLRAGVADSVRQCQEAGVCVRMVTGDNLLTAKAIGESCGLYTPSGIAIEGPDFRKLTSDELDRMLPRLQVLARASPEDKKTLVCHLQRLGETVAVTGDGTNDAPALKAADVGFSMGIAGTEVAKEASDIVLLDDNFNSLVRAIAWGRTVNDAVRKFLQFQITVNITAVLVTLVSAIASNNETSVLSAVQLLWVNLIMDTFAALALATDPPPRQILRRKPDPRNAPLISLTMWKMIIGQSTYQLAATLIMNFAGRLIYDVDNPQQLLQLQSLVFNTFVWTQVFNQYNCRRIDNGLNIFEGVHRNVWFLGIQVIIVAGQVLIISVGGPAFSVHPLNGVEWAISLGLGLLSLPLAVLIRLCPAESLLQRFRLPDLGRLWSKIKVRRSVARAPMSAGDV